MGSLDQAYVRVVVRCTTLIDLHGYRAAFGALYGDTPNKKHQDHNPHLGTP